MTIQKVFFASTQRSPNNIGNVSKETHIRFVKNRSCFFCMSKKWSEVQRGALYDIDIHSSNCQLFQMDKNKKKLNNSASLGKTIARGPQPHSKSFFVDPVDSVNISQQKQTSIKRRYGESQSRSKVSSVKVPMRKPVNVVDSISNIQQNRKYCSKMDSDLHSSMIEKSMRVNRQLREVHHFSICVQELKWLLAQGDKLIQSHLKQTQLISPESSYTQDVSVLAKEFKSLLLRFVSIDKVNLKSIQEYLFRSSQLKEERIQTIGFSSFDETKVINLQRNPKSLAESLALIKEKEETRQNSFAFPKNCSVPLKENIDKSNLSVHFENIKIVPQKQSSNKAKEHVSNSIRASAQVNLEEEFQKQRQDLYSKLKSMHERNEELSLQIELLKDENKVKDGKISHYKVMSTRSVQQLGDVLRRLVTNLTKGEKEFEMLKMAQCLSNWQKMLEDELEDVRFNALYSDDKDVNLQRTQKLQEIIGLQYEINTLLGQKKYLEQESLQKMSQSNNKSEMDQFYRMLTIQAISLEELCNF